MSLYFVLQKFWSSKIIIKIINNPQKNIWT